MHFRPRHPSHPPRSLRGRLSHSLRWRLVALFVLLALATTAVFVAGTRQVFFTGWRGVAMPLIADYVDRLAAEIGNPPDLARARAIVQRLPVAIHIDGPRLQWDSHPDRQRFHERVRDGRSPRDEMVRTLLTRHTADGHRIVFGVGSLQWPQRPVWAGWATLLGLLLLTALAFAYVRHLLRPLDDIRAGAQRYGAGDFSQAIPQRRHDELGELAGQVNAMAEGLNRMLEGQRGLLLAISHELRSPLTRARLNAELVADGPERDALLRDLAAMRDLIADLLESERLARGDASLQREPTDLNALAGSLVASEFAGRGVTLDLAPALPMLALDRVRLQLLLRNLLDNALRHGAGTPVRLSTGLQAGGVQLAVRDHGPGADPATLARLAEPFFRPDAARSRERGGVGLGLYLSRLVAQSHGGRLDIASADPGLVVSAWLPLAQAG
ncbi:HAMP domain-containing sensor histidine kinase [Aquabacterium sp. OR-4]|uniref:HAMP domain-containing sensor histidine kinase n=1 Tax=Aquabacterium sp. OR-4 TaxID=2978127 RepID=UPI0028C95F58|nr:ATP-binding protein [Aquabacterium sp. OR-4]MDT7836317.1 ATP-binding protein [Aquabacterium sp. OR-4]